MEVFFGNSPELHLGDAFLTVPCPFLSLSLSLYIAEVPCVSYYGLFNSYALLLE